MKNYTGLQPSPVCLSWCGTAGAFECKVKEEPWQSPMATCFDNDCALWSSRTGQVAAAMAEAVTGHTDVAINRDHKPGGSGTVGMTAYMAAPADGYNVLEHIDDASSAHVDPFPPNPAADLIVVAQVTFSQVYIRSNETRYTDWQSFVEWVKAQDGKATIANVSKEGSME